MPRETAERKAHLKAVQEDSARLMSMLELTRGRVFVNKIRSALAGDKLSRKDALAIRREVRQEAARRFQDDIDSIGKSLEQVEQEIYQEMQVGSDVDLKSIVDEAISKGEATINKKVPYNPKAAPGGGINPVPNRPGTKP